MYEDLLHLVEKPSRYLGNEVGSVRKDPAGCRVHWLLCYPDLYEVGMSNTGLPILYYLLNETEDIAAERVFLPALDMQKLMREAGRELLSLETRRPVRAFDVFGIQLPHEMCYTNLVMLLDLAGIPVRASERREDDPIVLGGGPGAFAPEPVAPLYDALLVGDGEDAVVAISDCIRCAKDERAERGELLERLARIEGVYVPAHFEPEYHADGRVKAIRSLRPERPVVRKALIDDLETAYYPEKAIVPYTDTVHNRLGVEIMRGCTVGCRFCQAGMIYRPLRERSPGKILSLAERGLCATGFEDVSLLSLDTGDYTMIDSLAQRIVAMNDARRVSTSLPSLRAGSLTDETIRQIKKVRKSHFTIAPEAGTQRLRDVINKNISQDEVWDTVERVARQGWTSIKFYFMCGIPTETDEDLHGIYEMAVRAREIAQRFVRRFEVTVSLGAHVPKPHTPFQWEEQIGPEEAGRRIAFVRDLCFSQAIGFRPWDPEVSWLEGVFSRGDRRLFEAVLEATRRGGGFEAWQDHFDKRLWEGVFADLGIDPMWYHRRRDWDEVLPWDHIDSRVTKKFLMKDAQKVYRELRDPARTELRTTADCRDDQCAGCAVCFEGDTRNRLAKYDPHPFAHDPGNEQTIVRGAETRGRRLPLITDAPAPEVELPDNRKWQTKPGAPGVAGPAPHYVERVRRGEPEPVRKRVASIAEGRRAEREAAGEGGEPVEQRESAIEWPAQTSPEELRAILALQRREEAAARGEPPPDGPAVERFVYRVSWTKTGRLRHLSHREILNVFYRALQRTSLRLVYTEGFHPKPRVAFGPGLPVGVESLCEQADIHLAEDVAPEELLSRLRAALPVEHGIEVREARRLERGEPSIQAAIGTARYKLYFDALAGRDAAGERARLRAAVAELLASDVVEVMRGRETGKRKRKKRPMNMRPLVADLVLEEPAGSRELGELSRPPVLHVGTRIGENGEAVRPRELLAALLPDAPELIEHVRVVKVSVAAAIEPEPTTAGT